MSYSAVVNTRFAVCAFGHYKGYGGEERFDIPEFPGG